MVEQLEVVDGSELLEGLRPVVLESREVTGKLVTTEFAVILTDVRDLDGLAQAAQRLIAAIAEPVTVNDVEVAITASVGVAVLDGEKNESKILQSETEAVRHRLFMQADRALYRAKQKGRSGLEFHDHEMDREISMRISLGRELRGVLSRDEIYLEYQPQVGPRGAHRYRSRGSIALAQSRTRCRRTLAVHSDCGELRVRSEPSAGGFWKSPAARQSGGAKSTLPASRSLSTFRLCSSATPTCRTLWDRCSKIISFPLTSWSSNSPKASFCTRLPDVRKSLEQLNHEIGVTISLDDFGRGFSSLEYLYRLPFDKLKVDRFFVSTMDEDSASFAIVSAIVALGKKLGLVVIAEGVERKEQAESLRSLGCDRAQGYYYSKSISSRPLSDILAAGGKNRSIRRYGHHHLVA